VNEWLESQSRIQLILLPPRNSQLNPTERIWWWLKGNVAANRTWDKLTALREACNRQLDSLTPEKAVRLTNLAAQGAQNFWVFTYSGEQAMADGVWILERCADERFPYRLQILRGKDLWLVLRAQDRWPAAGRNIFCLREKEPPGANEILKEIERVPIVAFHERGRRVSVVLERKRYKRCDFLFLSKPYKRSPGESYEQIFWLTQRSIEQHRPSYKLVATAGSTPFTVCIDSNERYPWRFPGITIERDPLPTGDYALVDEGGILAIVERKTLDNLLADFGMMPVLHQRLAELATHDNHALVIEPPR
jgi:hypothetical protein